MLELETVDCLWREVESLCPGDLQALAAKTEATSYWKLDDIRARHHRIAKLLATGHSVVEVSRRTGFHTNTITRLKASPAFENLILHYTQELDGSVDELHDRMNMVALQLLDAIQDRLEKPDEMEDETLKDLVLSFREVVDRLGYSPIHKVQQATALVDADFIREMKNAQNGGGPAVGRALSAPGVRENPLARFASEGEEF